MKKLAVLVLLLMLIIPVLPVALADDSTTNVDIGIGADTVNLNVTCTTSTGGTMHIYINGTEVTKTYVTEVHEHNYDGAITYLNGKINGLNFNMIVYANQTDGKLSILLANDGCLATWIGCLNSTSPIGQRILDKNSTVVMELIRLTDNDAVLLNMIKNMGNTTMQLQIQINERKSAEEELRGLLAKLQSESNSTNMELEATNRDLAVTTNKLLDTKAQFNQVCLALEVAVLLLALAWLAVKKPWIKLRELKRDWKHLVDSF